MEINDDYQEVYLYNLLDVYQKINPKEINTWQSFLNGMKDSTIARYVNFSNENTAELVQPLITRWQNPKIFIVRSYVEIDWSDNFTRDLHMLRIWNKLNNLLDSYLPIIKKYKELYSKDTFESIVEGSSSSVNKHNDTPTSEGDYSADKYTSDINQATGSSSSRQSTNEFETFDILQTRIKSMAQEIIEEMKEFEIYD